MLRQRCQALKTPGWKPAWLSIPVAAVVVVVVVVADRRPLHPVLGGGGGSRYPLVLVVIFA